MSEKYDGAKGAAAYRILLKQEIERRKLDGTYNAWVRIGDREYNRLCREIAADHWASIKQKAPDDAQT
jgi:hypothetical protein